MEQTDFRIKKIVKFNPNTTTEDREVQGKKYESRPFKGAYEIHDPYSQTEIKLF